MHESVVALQTLIAEIRGSISALAAELDHAAANNVTLVNQANLEEEVRARTKRCDDLDALIGEYVDAEQAGQATGAALKLVLVQFAAASMVEAKRAGEVPGGR